MYYIYYVHMYIFINIFICFIYILYTTINYLNLHSKGNKPEKYMTKTIM